jgi:hypothetical protein
VANVVSASGGNAAGNNVLTGSETVGDTATNHNQVFPRTATAKRETRGRHLREEQDYDQSII